MGWFNSTNEILEGPCNVDRLCLPHKTLPLNKLMPILAERSAEKSGVPQLLQFRASHQIHETPHLRTEKF